MYLRPLALARDAAALTHGHPSGYLSAAYFASLVFDVSRGSSLTDAMHAADGLLAGERGHEETAAVIAKVRSLAGGGPPSASTLETIGGGWVGEEALGIERVARDLHEVITGDEDVVVHGYPPN